MSAVETRKMISNSALLEDLIAKGLIRIRDSEIFKVIPAALPESVCLSKIDGMLLGLAIGDALGATSEGMTSDERYKKCGEIRDYYPGKRNDYKNIGVPTDDSQLAFRTLDQLINDGGLVPDRLATRFCQHRIFGIGTTTKTFVRRYKDQGIPWQQAGLDSLGNGALMRIAPILVPYTRRPDPSMYADAAIDGMLTHNSYANNATCVAYVHILWNLLSMSDAPEPEWWVDTFCSVASELEGETKYKARYPGLSYEGPLWKFVDFQVRDALRQKLSVKEACYRWGSGANLFETVPSVLYILATHSQNTEEAMVRAVNDAKDNDTTAAIVGAAVGALHGSQSIPKPWLDKLTGRTGKHNDGEVFKRILNAKHLFCLGS